MSDDSAMVDATPDRLQIDRSIRQYQADNDKTLIRLVSEQHTPRLCLRELRADDLPALIAMMADPKQVRYIEFEPTESSARALLDWSLRTAQESPRTVYSFGMTLAGETGGLGEIGSAGEDAIIGTCSIVVREPVNKAGNLGILLERRYHRRGIALEASQALLRFGFDVLGLHRLTGGCAAQNLASSRLMERLGMRREGHLLESHWQKGTWNDWFLYALRESEWRAKEGG